MTTTSVKDVGSVMNLGAMAGNATARTTDSSFQSVWNSQTKTGADEPRRSQELKRADDKGQPGEELRAKDQARKDVRRKEDTAGTEKEMTQEELEKVMEVVGTAVNELVARIAETFGISEEEVSKLMTDMNLQPVELLQPENLSNLLLEVTGTTDSLALLTNEKLYADYQTLMQQGNELVEAVSNELEISPEQLLQAVQTESVVTEPAEPGIRIEADAMENGTEEPILQNPDTASVEMQQTEQTGKQSENPGGGSEKQENHTKPDGESGNLVLQTIREESFEPQVDNARETAGTGRTDTQDMMRQIMDYMRVQVKPGMSNLEMQLHPASLGTLQIQVASRGGVLTANFITQNETVKAVLESQMIQLKQSFEEQGVKVEAIEVTVQTHQFEQNLEQGRGRQPQETTEGRRSRTRRINLGGTEEMIASDEMESEDRIAAEMLRANGGTVDFTA